MNIPEYLRKHLVAGVATAATVETISRIAWSVAQPDAPGALGAADSAFLALQGATVVASLAFRGKRLGLASIIGFGGSAVIELLAYATGFASVTLISGFFLLILPFALGRRGNTEQLAVGSVAMGSAVVATSTTEALRTTRAVNATEIVGASALLALFVTAGLVVRYRDKAHTHLVASLRGQEREQLARDLHDTVAHRVSAMMVQAQAGQTLLAQGNTDAGATAFATIEDEGRRALTEMRDVVATLRTPPTLATWDLANLAAPNAEPPVEVSVTGDWVSWPITVQETAYRITQEAITNARRHATNPTNVAVDANFSASKATVTITNDGVKDQATADASTVGFGLRGMTERARAVGGTVEAGPTSDGWRVHLSVPKRNAE